jgi:hypothetical protein
MANPPNYNNDQPGEELSFASSGVFRFYRFGNITPGNAEKLIAKEERESLTYYQRVFDSMLGWCYYSTKDNIDETPPPTITTPSHLGSISSHQVVSVVGLIKR